MCKGYTKGIGLRTKINGDPLNLCQAILGFSLLLDQCDFTVEVGLLFSVKS